MKNIYFKNKGLIDLRTIKTFGVSVKENENPIGFFGTGLKYALAIILRLGGEITLFVGEDEYKFENQKVNIRGKEFSLITMNGEELPFTTDLGKTWEPWQAFRELYCNTLDEHGIISDVELHPEQNYTLFVIASNEISDAYGQKDKYFLNKKNPQYIGKLLEIYSGITNSIFYRKINVGSFNHQAMFTYNFLSKIDLTEDRTIKYDFQPSFE